ncbi:MAG: hypothetical protein HFE84_06490 [Lachnospiraceae bacterium]|nr:hypothetical protein [Lachnospiraceae bacterium]
MMKKVIVILGMHQSGCDAAVQMCQSMANIQNGLEESFGNMEITSINEGLLRFYHKNWYDLEEFKPNFNSLRIRETAEKLKAVIQKLSKKNSTLLLHDPRMAELLPVWDKVFSGLEVEAQYIWLFRNPLEVAEALQKGNGYSKEHSFLLWIRYNLSILKFLRGKSYQLVNDRELFEHAQAFKGSKPIQEDRMGGTACSVQDTYRLQDELLQTLYESLVRKQEKKLDIEGLEKQYAERVLKKGKFIDYQVLEDPRNLSGKEIVIYGAGNAGKRAAKMLQDLGYDKFDFCDRNVSKQGMRIMGGRVFSAAEIETKRNLLFIIAVEQTELRKEIEQTLLYIKDAAFLSFFVLNLTWNCLKRDYTTVDMRLEALSLWYENLGKRGNRIEYTCKCPVLVYQNGKVGSSTVSDSLTSAGTENVHFHRFFFVKDIHGRLLLGDKQHKAMESFVSYSPYFSEYKEYIKRNMKHKKIITLVRDPIAVNVSSVFQWIGIGVANRYLVSRLQTGKTFAQAVCELMIEIQNRLFGWFFEELKESCDIDVFAYPFDKEKGYTILSQNGIEVLVIKTEQLSQMTEVIQKFVDNRRFELLNTNVGSDKEYAHLYAEVKKRLVLPKEYVEHYYINNPYMDHFYSKEEQKCFLDKWMQYVKED